MLKLIEVTIPKHKPGKVPDHKAVGEKLDEQGVALLSRAKYHVVPKSSVLYPWKPLASPRFDNKP